MDPHTRGRAYGEHLTRRDRELLVRAVGLAAGVTAEELRRRPERVEALLAEPAVFDAVFARSQDRQAALVGVSPFLAFALAVHRARAELADLSYVQEWTGPRQRVPVFVTEELRSFLDAPDHRLFLAELLASYTHVAGGAFTVRRRGVVYRRRFSELDLAGLAGLLDVATDETRPGVYRRLGDLALFLTGVFPDHTARHSFAPIEVDRLARAVHPTADARAERLLDALAVRGAVGLLEELGRRWYRLALETAGARTGTFATLQTVGERFVDARRVLNHLTDRHLFPLRAHWFPSAN
jgi:hypothetical protein